MKTVIHEVKNKWMELTVDQISQKARDLEDTAI